MKPHLLGITLGRFQPLHTGHEMIINSALSLCEKVAVFVGSSQEKRTAKNPFSFKERKEMLKTVFGDKIEVYPLPDIGVGNNPKWGEYVLKNIKEKCGMLPTLIVSGEEIRRESWFDDGGTEIERLYVKKVISISATEMRENFINGETEKWKSYTNEKLWCNYEKYKEIVLASKDNGKTESI